MLFRNYLIVASLTFACTQSALAMRCNAIKAFTFARKTNQYKAVSFCTKPTTSNDEYCPSRDLKRLEEIHDGIKVINPNCFNVTTKYAPCIHGDSCCRLAKKDIEQAWAGRAIRLKKDNKYLSAQLMEIKQHLLHLEQKNIAAQKIFVWSEDTAAIKPTYEKLWKLTKDMAECYAYTANIYGCDADEYSKRYYKKNPKGLFDKSKHMTPEERARENLQISCNLIYQRLMNNNDDTTNPNLFLEWVRFTTHREAYQQWSDKMGSEIEYFQKEEKKHAKKSKKTGLKKKRKTINKKIRLVRTMNRATTIKLVEGMQAYDKSIAENPE